MLPHKALVAGYWVLIGATAWLLLPFLSVALYSSPTTDDFCISSHSLRTSLQMVWNYYLNVTGRLPALAMIAIPSAIVRATGLDLYVVYPLVSAFFVLAFAAAMAATAAMIFPTANRLLAVLFGMLFAVFVLSSTVNIVEFVYWVTGAACYLAPTIGAALLVAWCAKQVLHREHIDRISLAVILALCLFTTMCNEFTVFFLIGVVAVSLVVRWIFMRADAQVVAHLSMMATTAAGYCVVLFSPSNAIRLSRFPQGRNVAEALNNASVYTAEYGKFLLNDAVVYSFVILTICFALATSRALRPRDAVQYIVFALAIWIVGALWAYTSYFVGAYSTGDVLALRARNEVIAIFLLVNVICIVALVHAITGLALHLTEFRAPSLANVVCFCLVALGTWHIRPVRTATTYQSIRTEWTQLVIYWEESVARNALLSGSPSPHVVVPRRTVAPTLLAGDELKEGPDQLPNDCVARYYGKASVVLAPLAKP